MQYENMSNPWNGLRTYTEGEILYGRNDEIHVLSLLILQNHQTVVYGRSGIGKSSILNAGVFPIVRKHGVFPVYIRFEHNVDVSYLDQIKAAINREIKASTNGLQQKELVAATEHESLWEFFHRISYIDANGNAMKPLIVFDQFEEIFTLETNRDKVGRFFNELANLINNVMPDELFSTAVDDKPATGNNSGDGILDLGLSLLSNVSDSYKHESEYHIVFTLREDFLSYLERNTTDIPALKNNRYCLQPINDEQAAEIIIQPRKGLVSVDVAKLIIEKVTGEENFEIDGVPEIQVDSAILSLYLSRLYEKMVAEGASTISRELVETYSANIIDDFYSDAIQGLSKESVEWLEDTLINEDQRRDNRDKQTVLREGHLSDDELKHLTDDVKLLRQFSYSGDLRIEFIHDVLCPIIAARREKRNENKRIQAIQEAAQAEKHRVMRRWAWVAGIAVAIAAIVAGVYLHNQYMNVWETEKYYADYEMQNGWPIGMGVELSKQQREKLPLYYKLSHEGRKSAPFDKIEVCSSNKIVNATDIKVPYIIGNPDDNDSEGEKFAETISEVRTMEFKPNQKGDVDYIAFLNSKGETLYTLKRYDTINGDWYSFTNPDGSAMTIHDSGIDRVKLSLDSLGYVSSISYFDNEGVKREVAANVYGYQKLYNTDNQTLTTIALDVFDKPCSAKPNANAIQYEANGNTYTILHYESLDQEPVNAVDARGVHKIVKRLENWDYYANNSSEPDAREEFTRDSHGNILSGQVRYLSSVRFSIPDKREYSYNDNGQILSMKLLTDNGRPFSPNHAICTRSCKYDADGNIIYEERSNDQGRQYLYSKQTTGNVVVTETEDKSKGKSYVMQIDSVNGDECVITYLNEQHKPINSYFEDQECCKVIKKTDGNNKTYKCYTYTNGNIEPAEYFIIENSYDSNDNLLSNRAYNKNKDVVLSMLYYYQNGNEIGHSAMGIDGNAVRCDKWDIDGFLYYKLYYNYDFNENYCSFKSVNEFDIASTAWNSNLGNFTIDYHNFRNNNVIATEGLANIIERIRIQKDYWQYYAKRDNNISNYKVGYLHILSKTSQLYSMGLRDGDILVNGGEFITEVSPEQLISRVNSTGEIEVLRADVASKTYKRHKISVNQPVSDSEAKMIHIHYMNLGNKEVDKVITQLK